MAASKAIVRRATLEDCDKIVQIDKGGEIYDGLDYIPNWIRPLTQDKAAHGFVTEIDGKIVSYCNSYMLKDGTKAIGMSARTLPEYRELGLYSKMLKHMKPMLLRKFPRLTTSLGTTNLEELPPNLKDYAIIENYFTQHTPAEALRKNIDNQKLNDLGRLSVILSPDGAVDLLTNDGIRKKFFHQKYINAYIFWWPISPTDGAMKELALRHTVAASFDNVMTSPPNNPQEVTAISFSDIIEGISKICLDVYFHGDDVNLLKGHIVTQIKQALNVVTNEVFGIKLHFPISMSRHKNEVDVFLKEVFNSPSTWGLRRYIIGGEMPFSKL